MSSVPAHYRENPWYRLVRCLVVLLVATLERRIARLIAAMEALPEDARFDAVFDRLDAKCAYLEYVRDRYLAWLDDPSVELPRGFGANVVVWKRRPLVPRPRRAGVRGRMAPRRAPPGRGRCTTTTAALAPASPVFPRREAAMSRAR